MHKHKIQKKTSLPSTLPYLPATKFPLSWDKYYYLLLEYPSRDILNLQFSKCGPGTPKSLQAVKKVTTIFMKTLRHYLPFFSHSLTSAQQFSRGYVTGDGVITLTVKGTCEADMRIQLSSVKTMLEICKNVEQCYPSQYILLFWGKFTYFSQKWYLY